MCRTESVLGSAEEIIRERTVLPFYFPYRPAIDAENAMSAVAMGGLGSIKGKLGILASRFGASHPLKACQQCMIQDLDVHHVSYWHRNHQWPGCWICPDHGCTLQFARAKVNMAGRFHWFLPADVVFSKGSPNLGRESTASAALRLSACSIGLGDLPAGFHFDPLSLVNTYRESMMDHGLATVTGRVHTEKFALHLQSVCTRLAAVAGLAVLTGTDTSLTSQFTRLVHEHRGSAHALKHLVLVVALFESWSEFMDAYRVEVRSKQSGHSVHRNNASPPENSDETEERAIKQRALVDAVRAGVSPSAAAASVGISVATAMVWLASAGIATPRRPKKLNADLRQWAILRLMQGASKLSVAATAGVSIETITLLLRSEPGLQPAWCSAKFQKAQRVARRSWQRTAGHLASPTSKLLRDLQPAVFAWLYRNDRAWLQAFALGLESAPRSNNAGIKWDERDLALAHAVRDAALKFRTKNPQSSLNLSHLCDEVAHLKPRLSNLDRLPLTRAAISAVVGRH